MGLSQDDLQQSKFSVSHVTFANCRSPILVGRLTHGPHWRQTSCLLAVQDEPGAAAPVHRCADTTISFDRYPKLVIPSSPG
jgi:hypothetical protein